MPRGQNGETRLCPRCKALTFQTLKRQGALCIYTCRVKDCGQVYRHWESIAS